ncbi:MAG: cytochrome c [Anaerolineales bacterium]|nr:cytochrome c [Anaerolineales bacterium]
MNWRNRRISFMFAGIAALVILSFSAFGGSDDKHHAGEQKQEQGGNPLIEEMVALNAVFRDVVSAVAMSNGHRVHEALEKMHGTMEKTHAGVKHGTVTLKKNAERLNDFVEQDKQFHGKLEDLAKAAHKNDGSAMLALTKDLLDRCVKCHRDFRQP